MKSASRLLFPGLCLCLAFGAAHAAQFAAAPEVKAEKDGVHIAFAADEAVDVAVEILDAQGETVRHLAAGVLGENAPEPLKPGLAQALVWDRKDDLGKDVPAGSYAVRVGLGLKPSLKKLENYAPTALGMLYGVAPLPGGNFVLAGAPRYGITRYMILDRDGNGVKQLYPPPADMKPEVSPGLPFFQRGDGRWVPLLEEGLPTVTTHTAMTAVGGKLFICPDNGGAPRVIDLKTCGLQKPLADPLIGWGKGKVCIRGAAASPDGKYLYFTGINGRAYGQFNLLHAVYRLATDGSAPAAVFFGTPEAAGGAETGLNMPIGLATDKNGNLYVADNNNKRVVVIKPDGKFLRAFSTPPPIFVQVHPRTGEFYLLSGELKYKSDDRNLGWRGAGVKVEKFAPDGKPVAALNVPKPLEYATYGGLALDPAKDPAVLWLSSRGWAGASKIDRIEDCGAELAALAEVKTGSRPGFGASPFGSDPRYVNNTPDYPPYREAVEYNYFPDEGTPFYSLAPDAKGVWADGNTYSRKDWKFPGGLQRMKADKSPLPFAALGTNVLEVAEKAGGSGWFPNRGTMVDRRGHIFFRYSYYNEQKLSLDKAISSTTGIEQHGPDGRKISIVHLSNSTYGMGVDVRGNLYVGDKPHPAGLTVPADIEAAFQGKVPKAVAESYGCVMKFGPEGGTYVWKSGAPTGVVARVKGDLWKVPPADLDAYDNYGRRQTADLKGAKWMWLGMSHIPTYHSCICIGTEMGVDPHGRVFVPDRVACRVAVLDANGNLIRYIGAYGNVDSRGKGSAVPDPEIAFAAIRMVIPAATSRQFRVADTGNDWVSVINLAYEKESRVPVVIAKQ